jgi:hypothetical protein
MVPELTGPLDTRYFDAFDDGVASGFEDAGSVRVRRGRIAEGDLPFVGFSYVYYGLFLIKYD